uniref:Uncharacterized protein n=1 Tax=Arion vulgaris TaxID=1028688 RepID=A0A0B6ZL78_9EUPU
MLVIEASGLPLRCTDSSWTLKRHDTFPEDHNATRKYKWMRGEDDSATTGRITSEK